MEIHRKKICFAAVLLFVFLLFTAFPLKAAADNSDTFWTELYNKALTYTGSEAQAKTIVNTWYSYNLTTSGSTIRARVESNEAVESQVFYKWFDHYYPGSPYSSGNRNLDAMYTYIDTRRNSNADVQQAVSDAEEDNIVAPDSDSYRIVTGTATMAPAATTAPSADDTVVMPSTKERIANVRNELSGSGEQLVAKMYQLYDGLIGICGAIATVSMIFNTILFLTSSEKNAEKAFGRVKFIVIAMVVIYMLPIIINLAIQIFSQNAWNPWNPDGQITW